MVLTRLSTKGPRLSGKPEVKRFQVLGSIRGAMFSMDREASIWRSYLSSGQIRLVYIEPANDVTDRINCRLEISSLDSIPAKFAAISYTWGGEQPDVYISCNGRRLAVTKSCDGALRACRSLGGCVVWIDQLCVNQEDLDERSAQVMLMGQIYSQAEQVYIWLGEFGSAEQPGSLWQYLDHLTPVTMKSELSSLFGAINKLPSSDLQNYEAINSVVDYLLELGPHDRKQRQSLETVKTRLNLLLNLLHRPYHGRRWIIQEISVNQSVTVLIGDLCFPFADLASLASMIRPIFSLINHKQVRQHFTARLGQTLTDRFWDGTLLWLHLTNIDMISRIRESLDRGKPLDLVDLMLQCSMFRVKEAVDDLYAIRALINHTTASAAPAPNYAASVEDVYLDYTAWLFSQGQGLRVLSSLPLSFQYKPNLPTWTVDFSTGFDLMIGQTRIDVRLGYRNEIFWDYLSESRTPGLHDDGSSFEADLATFQATLPRGAATLALPITTPLIYGRKLHIDGLVLDTITEMMPRNTAFSLPGIVGAHRWFRSTLPGKQSHEVRERILSEETFLQSLDYGSHNDHCVAFREKILYNLACNPDPPIFDRHEGFIHMPDAPNNPQSPEFATMYEEGKDEMMMTLLGSIRFACTAKGFPVLVPIDARQGDQVAFFPGVSKPFLLRESPAKGEYTLVGQMHVLGLMWWDESVLDLAGMRDPQRLILL